MKFSSVFKSLKFFSAIVILSGISLPMAAATDSEGMPVVYLRGNFSGQNWGVDDNYKFTREGSTYTLVIGEDNPVTEGSFKIGDADWTDIDLGGSTKEIYIDESCTQYLKRSGENLKTHGISEGTISFSYVPGNYCAVTFTVGDSAPSIDGLLSGSLPVMYINVYTGEDHSVFNYEIIDMNLGHKDYFDYAEYWIDLNGCNWMAEEGAESIGSKEKPLALQIKARGNWTRIGFSKKPFKIKLDKKQNLLGITPAKSKHYALLAHADDNNGYLRNYTAFNLGNRIGLPWTPGMQPVELVINNDYRGLYFLTESIRVDEGRVEIEELDDNADDPALISGGYLVELDNYDEDNQIRMDEKYCVSGQQIDLLRITWDTPEIYSDLQKKFVKDQFEAINNAVGKNSDELWEYLDLDDAARYYLVNEIIGHTEAYHGSTYLYRDRGEGQKWHFSPLWDAGNAFRGHTDQFFYNCDPFGNTWIPSMRINDMFNDKVKETWLWFMQNEYPGIEEDMDLYVEHLKAAAKSDKMRWSGKAFPEGGQPVADNSDMESRLNEVKHILDSKVAWLTTQFGDFTTGIYEEPERDTTPAAPLPEYAQAGVSTIHIDTANPDTVEFYNLQGMKVLNPRKGEIYIVKRGNQSFKYIFR